MNRRGFLRSILAAGMAPAVVKAESLMRIAAPKIWTPPDDLNCVMFNNRLWIAPKNGNRVLYSSPIEEEIVRVTRQAFIPKLRIEIYKTGALEEFLRTLPRG